MDDATTSAQKGSTPPAANAPARRRGPAQRERPPDKRTKKEMRGRKRKAAGAAAPLADDGEKEAEQHHGDRQFISALARGLEVLSAFRAKDGPLGNQELSARTGIPAPTVSRITYTLTRLGYLAFNKRLETYDLGGSALSLSFVAMAHLDMRAIARPLMEDLARAGNCIVALAKRDRQMMLLVETVESDALVGLRLLPGARMPIAKTALGRAYLAALPEAEREAILDQLRPQFGAEWTTVRRNVEKAVRDVERQGFCTSIGEWRQDINGAGAVVSMPDGAEPLAIDVGGPAYLVPEREILDALGPRLAQTAGQIGALLSPRRPQAADDLRR
jgi:DNA-binding IclR family transcriptional regulator